MWTVKTSHGDTKHDGVANFSFALGIFGLLIFWYVPIVGFLLATAGLISGIKGMGSMKKAVALIGIVLSVICLMGSVISAIIWGFNSATESKKSTITACQDRATAEATQTLKSKAEIGSGTYKKAADQGLYLKSDYDFSYSQCLQRNGIESDSN